MKANLPSRADLTANERRKLVREIRAECVNQTRQYEVQLDLVMLYALHTHPKTKFGKKRLEEFYEFYFKMRREMQERFQVDEDDDFAIDYFLKQDGIDVEAMYKALDQEDREKFKVGFRNGNG